MAFSLSHVPFLHLSPSSSNLNPISRFQNPNSSFAGLKTLRIRSAKRSQRIGKRRYPSEKKKLEQSRPETLTDVKNKEEGFWRLSKLSVPVDKDPGKDHLGISDGLLEAIAKVLEFPVATMLPQEAFSIVRKSFDARKLLKEPKFIYTVDMDVKKLLNLEPRTWDFVSRLEPKVGVVEYIPNEKVSGDLINIIDDSRRIGIGIGSNGSPHNTHSGESCKFPKLKKPRVAVVGSGPAGLFAALVLGELGAEVTLIERGQAVEKRGRDIGALVVRRILQSESNLCFGEGGAGTWSDGKLVTRIGRNSNSVQAVMKTLVHFGAPPNILVDGKPHLGTDKLVPLLRNFRQHLQQLGVNLMFGTRLDDLLVENGRVVGVKVSNVNHGLPSTVQKLVYDAVVLAVGHSARDVYEMLLQYNVDLFPKDFAVGLRIEHPQELINNMQYSALATEVRDGRGKVPVADYKVVKYVGEEEIGAAAGSGETTRSCYSFCMCPGGQIVLTSTNPTELCINGMSFSRRASRWANAALVITVSSKDFEAMQCHGPLAGVEFQREFERRAATMGGGNFVVPAQSVTDFLENKLSDTPLPRSSYRLGVKAANLHELYPAHITQALQHSITMFDKELPGFISKDALLHGVETRTSSPLQIPRNSENYESKSLKGLYPIGEGAGYAGGIVSAAVDGLYAGFAVAKDLNLYEGGIEAVLGKAQKNTGFVKY
ncbi:Pyridine nucleotide-disulfide oxidoreductase [Cinnamomum micranthum f. kanehirae]|uniref:Pyridine nucleotide-disulfide oxidoreductase n=1 Tax=Cinnamomum micranthum f. kanehirae TaxID=337451 RepID=A0A3S4NCP7_9MAGN|nr:Pyridine nucleotide-disulfide oxidoreductase [Cinnamomum micranthum f. kanehirae]